MNVRWLLILIVVTGSTAPVLGAEWTRYVNPRFGAAVDIPEQFSPDGAVQSVQADGKQYRSRDGRSTISVWGGSLSGGDFSADASARIDADQSEGWSVTYRSVTPDWAAWSGNRSGMVVYSKSIATCDGRQSANVRLVYPALDIPHFDAIASRLGASLGQDGACF